MEGIVGSGQHFELITDFFNQVPDIVTDPSVREILPSLVVFFAWLCFLVIGPRLVRSRKSTFEDLTTDILLVSANLLFIVLRLVTFSTALAHPGLVIFVTLIFFAAFLLWVFTKFFQETTTHSQTPTGCFGGFIFVLAGSTFVFGMANVALLWIVVIYSAMRVINAGAHMCGRSGFLSYSVQRITNAFVHP